MNQSETAEPSPETGASRRRYDLAAAANTCLTLAVWSFALAFQLAPSALLAGAYLTCQFVYGLAGLPLAYASYGEPVDGRVLTWMNRYFYPVSWLLSLVMVAWFGIL